MKRILTLALLGISALIHSQVSVQAVPTLVSPSEAGSGITESQSLSGNGNYVAFSSSSTDLITPDSNGSKDIFVRNLTTDDLECVSQDGGLFGNSDSINPSISTDGRFVAFQSLADNLVADDTNGSPSPSDGEDIFVYDRTLDTIKRVSIRPNGYQATLPSQTPSISGDGAFVAFASQDTELSGPTIGADWYIYIVDVANVGNNGSVVQIPLPDAPDYVSKKCLNPSISADGNFVAFEFDVDDGNSMPPFHYRDVYVYNRTTGQNTRITGDSSTDGFDWDGYIYQNSSISADGSAVAFESNAPVTNDDIGGTNVFVANIGAAITYRLVSKDILGEPGDADSTQPAISGNGRFVSFQTGSSNFSGGATNQDDHVYEKNLSTEALTLMENPEGSSDSYAPAVSDDGSKVSYLSDASNLSATDTNGNTDVYVATLPAGPAVLAFDEDSDATSIVDVTGSYDGTFPHTDNEYTADAAMDESGKVDAMGNLEDYSNPKGNDLRMKGTLKTVNDTPTVSGKGSLNGGVMDGDAVSGSGKITVPLEEDSTEEGDVEFPGAVASGSARRNDESFKQLPTMVAVPAQAENVSKDWSLALSIYERTDSKGNPYLAAFSTLYLPNGERTKFAEKKMKLNAKTGLYSIAFTSGTKVDEALEPILNTKGKPVIDKKSKITIINLTVEPTGAPRTPTAGLMNYQFLGQKGSGDLLEFF